MKRFSSILLAVLVATLMLVSNVRAQQYSGNNAPPPDWQNALGTWNVPTFPGQLNDNTIAIVNATAAPVFGNVGGVPNRVRALQINSNFGTTLNGTGTIVIGALNINVAQSLTIGAGLNVVIDSIIDGAAGSTIIVNPGGRLTLRRGANAPAQQVLLGGTIMAAGSLNGEVVIENGFNGGEFPTNLFYIAPPAAATAMACLNAITVNAPMNIGENITTPPGGGIFTVNGGVLQVTPGGTLQLGQTTPNSLQGTGTLNAVIGGSVVLGANFNANILPGQRFSNPFTGTLTVNSPVTVNSNMTFSPVTPTATQESVLNLLAATASLTVPAGVTVRFNNNINNGLQGAVAANVVIVNAGATVVLGTGFNAGVIPSARFSTINGTLQTIGPMSLNVTGAPAGGMFSSTGQFEIGGDLTLAGAGQLEFSQTGPNSIRATAASNARIISPGFNTGVQFNANSNNGVLPGCLLASPFSGFVTIRSSMSLSCDLSMATDAGPFNFDATTVGATAPIILTVQPNVTLALRQNVAARMTAGLAGAPVETPEFCYIQGVNNTSRVILGLAANGGTVPSGAGAGAVPTVPFLPLSGIATFNGRLVLEGSLTLATNLAMGSGSILDLAGGNLTVQATRTLRLLNSGTNSLTGTGFIQGVAPTVNSFRMTGQGAANHGSIVEIGPSMNGTIFPAARFANPFQGNIDFSTAGTVTVQGDFVHSIPQGNGYFIVGDVLNGVSTANITIAANSSVRLNAINPSSLFGSAVYNPPVPVFPGGSFQGTDQTSRLVIGTGHAGGTNGIAFTTTGTWLANPFNGTLAFAGNAIMFTSATIGVTGGLELGGNVSIINGAGSGYSLNSTLVGTIGGGATATYGFHFQPATGTVVDGTAAGPAYYSPITVTLNNQAAGSISGLGTFLTATGNTLVFGSGANGGIIPGNRLASPHHGTIATVGPMTLQGNLTIGDLRDGYFGRDAGAATVNQMHSSGFLKLGAQLTIDNGAVLTVSNATAQPFSTRFGGNASKFQVSTNGSGTIQALPNGELRILDGFNSRNLGGSSASNYAAAQGQVSTTLRNEIAAYIPTQSFFHPGFLASPFNGKLFFGSDMPQAGHATLAARSFTGGFSRFNITTGTLNIGTTGFLGLVSRVNVSSGTALLNTDSRLSDGYPRVILSQTGPNTLVGTTTGSVLQSSSGSFHVGGANFVMGQAQPNGIGGSVTLGAGFNGGIIPASVFGNPYAGRLNMPNAAGTLTVVGNLDMSGFNTVEPNYGIVNLGGANTVLNVQDGSRLTLGTTGTVNPATGVQTNIYAPGYAWYTGMSDAGLAGISTAEKQTFRALQGNGVIQGGGNNARVVIPGTMNDGHITGANFAVPFNGRMVISTGNNIASNPGGSSRMFLIGSLTFGAVGSNNGVLEIQSPNYIATNFTNQVAPELVIAGLNNAGLDGGGSITFNNISPVSVVLPGNGVVVATTNIGRVIVGPNALANIVPAAQLRQPFVGQLIITNATVAGPNPPTVTVNPYTMNAPLTLALDPLTILTGGNSFGAPGLLNGYLRTFADINLGTNTELNVKNFSLGTLAGTGRIGGTDVTSVVRFGNYLGFGANGGHIGTMVERNAGSIRASTVQTGGFASPFDGTIVTEIWQNSPTALTAMAINEPPRNTFTLFGRLTLGAPGSSNGVLNTSGATIYLAAADLAGAGVNATVANLVINNVSPLSIALPGAGLFNVRGLVQGTGVAGFRNDGHPAPMSAVAANAGGNASVAFGPGALAGNFPADRFQVSVSPLAHPTLSAIGNVIPLDNRYDGNWVYGVRGTIMTSTGTMTSTTSNLNFVNGGTLLIGGPELRYATDNAMLVPASQPFFPYSLVPYTAALTVPDGIIVTIATVHRGAFGGNGGLVLGGTNATLFFGADGNQGILYGQHLNGGQTNGRWTVNANTVPISGQVATQLRGNLRFGVGTNVAGHLAITAATAQVQIAAQSALNLNATKLVAIASINGTPATGLITGVTTSSVLILGPDYGRFKHQNNAATPNLDHQAGRIEQAYPMLNTDVSGAPNTGFAGTLVTSTGTIQVTNQTAVVANLGILGALQMGGTFEVRENATVQFNNSGALTFRRTLGSTGGLLANAHARTGLSQVNLGVNVPGPTLDHNRLNSFNNGVLPTNLLFTSSGTITTNGAPINSITGGTGAFGTTRATARLNINSSNLTLARSNATGVPVIGNTELSETQAVGAGSNLYMHGDLNFTANGGDLNIPVSSQLTINGGFNRTAGFPNAVVTGVNSTSVLAIAPAARLNGIPATPNANNDNTLDAQSPQLGARGVAPAPSVGFNGTLRLLSSGYSEAQNNTFLVNANIQVSNLGISGITVTIGTAGVIDMESTRSTIVLRTANARLNLNNTGTNSFMPSLVAAQGNGMLREATTSIISLQAPSGVAGTQSITAATVSLGAGFNNSTVPGTLLSAYRLQAGPQYIMNSSLNLGSQMFVATTGSWNFNSGTNKLTLGANNMTVHSAVQNASQDRYFVTNDVGVVGLNGVGNVTFPVGPSATSYTPINLVNNAVASLFSVGARPRTVTVPAANANSNVVLSSVNAQWNVTQNNNVSAGVAALVNPQWPSSLQGAGFNSQLATVNRYASAAATAPAQSSTPAPASPVAGLTNYFTSTLVVTQTAIPGSLVSSPIIVTSQPTPAISSFTPSSGFNGSTVTIVGSRFTGVTAVTFGGTPAASFTVTANGDTIRAVVGSGANGNIVVTQAGGTASLGTFTYLGAPPTTPVITSALPAPILAGLGDAAVTITGTGFGSLNVRVLVTGSGLTGSITPTSNSATSIAITVPGQFTRNVGSITLQVVSSDRNPVSTTVPVAVAPATTLTGVTPAASTSGNLAAHTIELTGTSFGPQSVFSLNGVPLTIVGFTNNTNGTSTARVLVPAGVTSGDIVVTNLNNTTGRIPYTVNGLPRPVITSVNPLALLPGSPTTRLTVTGQNFIPGAVVTFNGQPLTTASVSATSIAFDVPANLLAQPDLATIRIINPDNQVIGYRFPISTVVPNNPDAPRVPVDSLGVPVSGSITPATTTATATAFQLTINGSNFRPGLIASLGGVPLTIVSVTDTRIVANVPASANVAGMAQLQLANGLAVTNLPYTITTGTGGGTTGVPTVSGAVQNGNRIIINGSNFAPGATVTFGPGNTPLTVVPGTNQLTATLPPNTSAGMYNVTVTNPGMGGGSVTAPVSITISVSTERLAATRVYPNPTVDVVNVEANLSRASTVVINVTNTLGQVVMTVRTNAGAGFFSKSINVENLPSGAYNIEVTDGTRRSIEKIIKN